jgi:RNA 2',3'-cyclic 3'-phosphodiesterase
MKRIFIALKVEAGANLLKMMSSFKDRLNRESVNWTNPGNIHITLAFLGDTDESLITQLVSMLNDHCSGTGEFELILKGAGVFRNLSDPRIIWTGIEPSHKVMHLNTLIIDGLKDLNIKFEERPFKPHLTLGRIKHINEKEILKELIEKFQYTELQVIPVNEVLLYESILLQSGPVYKPLAIISLG